MVWIAGHDWVTSGAAEVIKQIQALDEAMKRGGMDPSNSTLPSELTAAVTELQAPGSFVPRATQFNLSTAFSPLRRGYGASLLNPGRFDGGDALAAESDEEHEADINAGFYDDYGYSDISNETVSTSSNGIYSYGGGKHYFNLGKNVGVYSWEPPSLFTVTDSEYELGLGFLGTHAIAPPSGIPQSVQTGGLMGTTSAFIGATISTLYRKSGFYRPPEIVRLTEAMMRNLVVKKGLPPRGAAFLLNYRLPELMAQSRAAYSAYQASRSGFGLVSGAARGGAWGLAFVGSGMAGAYTGDRAGTYTVANMREAYGNRADLIYTYHTTGYGDFPGANFFGKYLGSVRLFGQAAGRDMSAFWRSWSSSNTR